MTQARDRILGRLRSAQPKPFARPNPRAGEPRAAHEHWEQRQEDLGDLTQRFVEGAKSVWTQVALVPSWDALPAAVTPWIGSLSIKSAITGREPRLETLRKHLATLGVDVRRYDRPIEEQKSDLFGTDLGITTTAGAIAETASLVLIPTPEEPRLLSLAVPVHLAVLERKSIVPTMADFIRSGTYQERVPTNLVFISSASRTADIELTLAMGVHGPKTLLIAVVG